MEDLNMVKMMMTTKLWRALDACRASKKDNREALLCLHITEKHIETTNGIQLIRFNRDNIGLDAAITGVFKVISITKAKLFTEVIIDAAPDVQYPDTLQVLPIIVTPLQNTDAIMLEDGNSISISGAIIRLFKITGNAFSYAVLERLAYINTRWGLCAGSMDKPDPTTWKSAKAILYNKEYGISTVILPFQLV